MTSPTQGPSRPAPRWVRLVRGLLLAAALLGAVEGGLRLFGFRFEPPTIPIVLYTPQMDALMADSVGMFGPSASLLWENNPGASDIYDPAGRHINDQGFRGEPLPPPRAPGHLRIACVGDSSTFGAHVAPEDTFSSRLEELLRAGGLEADVLNAGVVGYSSLQCRRLLETRILPLDPDVVVLYLGAINDGAPRPMKNPLSDREKLDHIAAGGSWRSRVFRATQSLRLGQLARRVVLGRPDWTGYARGLEQLHLTPEKAASGDYKKRVPLEEFRANVESCVRQVRDAGAVPVLVAPSRREILEEEIPYQRRYTETLLEVARELEVPCADVYTWVRSSPGGTDEHHVEGSRIHPSPSGHRVIAEQLGELILAELGSRSAANPPIR